MNNNNKTKECEKFFIRLCVRDLILHTAALCIPIPSFKIPKLQAALAFEETYTRKTLPSFLAVVAYIRYMLAQWKVLSVDVLSSEFEFWSCTKVFIYEDFMCALTSTKTTSDDYCYLILLYYGPTYKAYTLFHINK